jgi:hypothetical protein
MGNRFKGTERLLQQSVVDAGRHCVLPNLVEELGETLFRFRRRRQTAEQK